MPRALRQSSRVPSRLWRVVLVCIGTLSVALGALGVVLPLLPTTPFLLLAAACYARSSERFYVWLMTNRWCGAYLRNYREGRGLPLRQKVLTLALLWAMIGASACFAVANGWVRLLLFAIATGVTLHLLHLPTFKDSVIPPPRGTDERNAGVQESSRTVAVCMQTTQRNPHP